jgi:uncharacterized protein YkwD
MVLKSVRAVAFPHLALLLIGLAIVSILRTESPARVVYAAGDCTVSADDEKVDAEEASMMTKINEYRSQNNAAALTLSATLNRSSAMMSRDMATKGYFDHFDLSGRSPFQRMEDCGYTSYPRGENIGMASGYNTSTVDIIFNGWKQSPGHDAAMKNTQFKAAGIGKACSGSSCFWTLNLGGQVDSGVTLPPSAPTTVPPLAPTTLPTIVPTPIPTVVSTNLPAALTIQQVLSPGQTVATVTASNSSVVPGPTPIPSQTNASITTPATGVTAGTQDAASANAATEVARGWLNGPVSGALSVRSCPTSKTWEIVYWEGPETDIARAATYCATADRYWALRNGRWYGFSSRDTQTSDTWKVGMGEAVFARVP